MTFIHRRIVNIYIVYEISFSTRRYEITQYQKILLIGAVRSVKHTNISKYQYSGYDISFNKRRTFSFPIGGCGYDVIIFGADMSHFVHVDNKKKDIFILDEDPTQGLDDTTLTTEKNCSTNFTE